jgi:hypothetical protein
MLQIMRGMVVLFVVAGACAALTGCWEKEASTTTEDADSAARKQAADLIRRQAFATHHDRCVELFVKAEGLGVSRMPTLTHQLRDYPRSLSLPAEADALTQPPPGVPLPEAAASQWLMQKVELVGLLNHEKPGVYPAAGMMGRGFGGRDRLRDLDEFEQGALAELQKGEHVLMAESGGTVRVLGAIRARQACVKCHEKPEGTLLGALSYAFEPAKQ